MLSTHSYVHAHFLYENIYLFSYPLRIYVYRFWYTYISVMPHYRTESCGFKMNFFTLCPPMCRTMRKIICQGTGIENKSRIFAATALWCRYQSLIFYIFSIIFNPKNVFNSIFLTKQNYQLKRQ